MDEITLTENPAVADEFFQYHRELSTREGDEEDPLSTEEADELSAYRQKFPDFDAD